MPLATGKFSICTAKMKAATRPASGSLPVVELVARLAHADGDAAQRDDAPAATDVPALMNPSGMCTPTSCGPPLRRRPVDAILLADASGSQSSQRAAW